MLDTLFYYDNMFWFYRNFNSNPKKALLSQVLPKLKNLEKIFMPIMWLRPWTWIWWLKLGQMVPEKWIHLATNLAKFWTLTIWTSKTMLSLWLTSKPKRTILNGQFLTKKRSKVNNTLAINHHSESLMENLFFVSGLGIFDRNKIVCIGDINRMETQKKRGGGTVCFKNARTWLAFSKAVSLTEDCP